MESSIAVFLLGQSVCELLPTSHIFEFHIFRYYSAWVVAVVNNCSLHTGRCDSTCSSLLPQHLIEYCMHAMSIVLAQDRFYSDSKQLHDLIFNTLKNCDDVVFPSTSRMAHTHTCPAE